MLKGMENCKNVKMEILNFAEKEQFAEAEHLHLAEMTEYVEKVAEKSKLMKSPL